MNHFICISLNNTWCLQFSAIHLLHRSRRTGACSVWAEGCIEMTYLFVVFLTPIIRTSITEEGEIPKI